MRPTSSSSSQSHLGAMPSPSYSMQVTISLLPVSLSLVHIPRSRLPQLSHPVLHQILKPNPTFLNIICNEIELSLFAEHHMLDDFEPIARRDRQRLRSRSSSGSASKNSSTENWECVEVSYEKWNVLQIDFHSDQLENSGARVHELSAPLAAAGISILYQSSYMSDFIFVKESRMPEAMSLFASAGFDLYSPDLDLQTFQMGSPPLSPSTDDRSSFIDIGPAAPPGAVLTRSRRSTGDSQLSAGPRAEKSHTKESEEVSTPSTRTPKPGRTSPRAKSHSPASAEVRILSPDITCVGLSDDNVENWALKIVKLVAFPELIPSNSSHSNLTTVTQGSYINKYSTCHAGTLFESSSPLSSHFPNDWIRTSSDSSSSSSDEDGYFSHSPPANHSTSSLVTSAPRSYPDLTNISPASSSLNPSKHTMPALSPLSTADSTSKSRKPAPDFPASTTNESTPSSQHNASKVSLFSFTRTYEGSSLTTDVSLLATLFPPSERHMVICSGELDAADKRHMRRAELSSDDEDEDEQDASESSTLKCLQIDLRLFGLDKHGLVNRFSRVLEEDGINHMYSSTFKTANLLVDKKHAVRAQALLRAC